jgi:hypothetical protein
MDQGDQTSDLVFIPMVMPRHEVLIHSDAVTSTGFKHEAIGFIVGRTADGWRPFRSRAA